ncbi:MAG: M20/M25/M40 family metallo-hydrolase [Clostridia bacterium]|nr:M20/M25/M40 family metallo-hydrolase [Clostridia bacterium]
MPVKDIILRLSQAAGVAGAENSAAEAAAELLRPYASVGIDAMGNVVATIDNPDASEHILLDAHIDEVGMIVTRVDDKGFLRVAKCGGADRRTLTGVEVTVFGREPLDGVVCSTPPHLQKGGSTKVPDWDGIYIDIGLDAKKARELVPVGSRVIVRCEPRELLGGRITGKALDDRSGAASLIRAVEILSESGDKLPCKLTVLLSVQEETGGLGAQTGTFALEPTQAIAVDVSFAEQAGTPSGITAKLGGGPMIGISPVLDNEAQLMLHELAQQHDIPWQDEVMGGKTGTNADNIAITRGGVRCALISIPQRNMHTAVEIIDVQDVENTAQLIAHYVRAGGVARA